MLGFPRIRMYKLTIIVMDEYFSSPFEQFGQIEIDELEEIKQRNHEVKDIGDKVNVIDFSSVSFHRGSALDAMDLEDLNFNTVFMVVETNCKSYFKTEYHEYKQDLVIVDLKTNKYYRTISGHTKLI